MRDAAGLKDTFSESAGALLLVAEASTPLNPPNPVPPPKVEADPNTGVGDAACIQGLISDERMLTGLRRDAALGRTASSMMHICADHRSLYVLMC